MILVTGASGLLGANFLQVARQVGLEAMGTYHQFPLHSSDIATVQVDLTKKSDLTRLITRVNPTHILHCAALTNVDWCESHPEEAWKVNVEASRWLAQAAHDCSAKLIYISTDSVFDGKTGNYSENDLPNPVNVYARTKLAAEEAVLECSENNLVLRTNIYGWNLQDKLSLAEWMLQQLEREIEFAGFSDVVFSPIIVNDLGRIILKMIACELTGVFHVSGSQAISKYDFALEIARVFSLDSDHVRAASVKDLALTAQRPLNTSLQVGKIQNALGISMPSIQSGLLHFKILQEDGYVTNLQTLLGGLYNV